MTYTPEVDLSGLATKAELTEGLNGKANASTVGGLSTAVNSKASQTALDALAGTVPGPPGGIPAAIAETGAMGLVGQYATADHTHASKARRAKSQSVTTATYTWTYATPFAAGVVPICMAVAQTAGATSDLFNVQLEGAPTNTACVFRINRVSLGLLSLLLGALSINPTPASIMLHMVALEP